MSNHVYDYVHQAMERYHSYCHHYLQARFGTPEELAQAVVDGRVYAQGYVGYNNNVLEDLIVDNEVVARLAGPILPELTP